MQFLLWFTFGTFGIFYVAHLLSMGYSSRFIALGLTLSTILGTCAQYFWGYISDLTSRIKTIFLGLLIAMILVVAIFPLTLHSGPLTIVAVVLFGITWMPLEALLDSWILSTDELPHHEYGAIRSGGSFGFALITVIFGGLIVRFGFQVSIGAFVVSGLALFITALTTKTHTSKTPTPMGIEQVKALLTNGRYIAILLFSILIFINHMGINNYYIYVVRNIGGDESLIGMAASAAAFTEIFGFYICGKYMRKINPLAIMVVVAFGSLARVFFLSQSVTYVGVLLTAVLQGLMFSFFLGTFKVYISEITPMSLLASAQTVAASTYFGIAAVIANIMGGLIIDDYGMMVFYRWLISISAVAFLYAVIMLIYERKRNNVLEGS